MGCMMYAGERVRVCLFFVGGDIWCFLSFVVEGSSRLVGCM